MPCRSILLAVVGVLYAFASYADLNSAANDRARGEYAAAIAEYQRLAEAGDPVAQVNLGYMYYMGEGVAQDYGQALAWYGEAAAQGNADAQYNLAVAYAFGEGTAQDFTTAVKWYQMAADQGHAVAQYSLGLSFANGEGITRDPAKAMLWYTRSAEQGYIPAQIMLGSKYYAGDEVAPDHAAAARWYRLAAEQGNAIAQYNLAGLYRAGRGVERNDAEARTWYTKSAGQGYSAAAVELAAMGGTPSESVPQTTAESSPPVVTPAIEEAVTAPPVSVADNAGNETLTSAAAAQRPSLPASTTDLVKKQLANLDKGAPAASPGAAATTGLMTIDNIDPSLPVDDSSAATELLNATTERAAVSEDDASAAGRTDDKMVSDITVNEMADDSGSNREGFFSGLFGNAPVPANEQTADTPDSIPSAGAETTVARADPARLAVTYEKGLNELKNKNFGVAHDLFSSAATGGYAPAQYQLAMLCQQGLGTEQDKEAAALWYRRAAEQGVPEAQFNLANMYLMGEGILQNDAQARYWYERAAGQGHAEASHNLQNLSRLNPVSLEQAGLLSMDDPAAITTAPPVMAEAAVAVAGTTDAQEIAAPETMMASLSPALNTDTAGKASSDADYERGLAYAFGTELPKDLKTAFTYFRKAAENDHVPAQYKLAVAYAYGEGTGKDMAQAAYWYEKAAMRGHPLAQRNLGLMYLNGDGGTQNKPLALAWFGILADRGNVMDIQRMESLRNELTAAEIAQAEQLKQNLLEAMAKRTITKAGQ